MNLLAVHKVMITAAILFCAGFAVREAILLFTSGGIGMLPLLLGLFSAAASVLLGFYLKWLLRTKGRALDAAGTRRTSRRDN